MVRIYCICKGGNDSKHLTKFHVMRLELVGLVGCIFWLVWFGRFVFEGLVRYVCFVLLTLLGPAYLIISKDLGVGRG